MKHCSKCGHQNVDEAAFCMSCGTPLEMAPIAPVPVPAAYDMQGPAQEPPAEGQPAPEAPKSYYPQAAYNQNYTPQAPVPPPGASNTSVVWLALNIAITVLCCITCIPLVFSIIGIVMASKGMTAYNQGQYEEAAKNAKVSMIMFIIGVALGLLIIVGFLLFYVPLVSEFSNGFYNNFRDYGGFDYYQ